MALEQVIESGAAAFAGVCALDRLGELHLVAHEDDRLGGSSHCYQVSKRDLPGLVHKEHVAAGHQVWPSKRPGRAADDLSLIHI